MANDKLPVWLWWSSGKDSAWALHILKQSPEFEVVALVTTANEAFDRVAMHGVRMELVEEQARAAGLPLRTMLIPHPCSNDIYQEACARVFADAHAAGVWHMAFGDLFLADVRAYREKLITDAGLTPVFPLWGFATKALAYEMTAAGLRAHITCLDPKVMDQSYAGAEFSPEFLASLPDQIDPCGENGEFHTFAFAGPMFTNEIPVKTGETVTRDGFVFTDLLSA